MGQPKSCAHLTMIVYDMSTRRTVGRPLRLNHGLELARGEYITTLDVDDWLTPDSLVDRVSFLDAHPRYGVVYGDGYYCDAGGETFLTFSDHMPCGQSGDVYDLLIVSPFYGTGAAVMQRRDMLARFQIRYDESIVWCQDWDFYIRLAEFRPFGFVATKTIRYRIHSDSMTEAMPGGRRLESLIRLRKKVLGSQRFHSVSSSQKSAFFYDFIVKDLDGDFVKQERIINSREFSAIDKNEQARIQRLAANRYLLRENRLPSPSAGFGLHGGKCHSNRKQLWFC